MILYDIIKDIHDSFIKSYLLGYEFMCKISVSYTEEI